ncbi:MAG: response regulator [Archangium sp.]|nr:response regulator [Archangium sp.]
MLNDPALTSFLPAKRSSPDELEESVALMKANGAMTQLLQSMPDFVMLLDENRQVVFANAAMENALGTGLTGQRLGDVLSCRHATETAGGCGTAPSCRHCGAAQAILGSQQGRSMTEECRITAEKDEHEEALDLRVWTNQVNVEGRAFTLLSSRDIADEKRKAFLERIFLHDLMNTATALRGATAMMNGEAPDEHEETAQRIGSLSSRIIDEINSQRQLIAAESNELVAKPESLRSMDVLSSIHDASLNAELLNGRLIRIAEDAADVGFESDPSLLGRVVGNMTKNAIEATPPGQTVTLGCRLEDGKVAFWVNNPSHMPEKVRLQIFNRSFSTKGAGRGLGTYSMKYLTEKYLEGDISFTSTQDGGTTFVARYPLAMTVGAAQASRPQPGAKLPTVVVADDEPVLRKVLTAFLRRAGVKVLAEVEDGSEAIAACRQHRPDVLLIDANMPVMSGEDALTIIRAELPSVTSFLLTGEVDAGTIERALAAGARGYVAKGTPVPKIVESVIGQWQALMSR